MRTLLLAMVVAWALAPAVGQPLSTAPSVIKPKRLVHFFDFEERRFGNYEDLPMHWYVVGRPAQTSDPNFGRQPLHRALVGRDGFPAWAEVRFDGRHALSGEFSLMLAINGGNAGAFLEVGTLPAVPTSDYLVSAWVRTDGLRRASARVVAYFIDAQGVEVPGSRTASPPLRDAADWTEVSVKLSGDHPDAAWIGLELEATQPTPSLDDPLGDQQVVLRDVGGGVWFDDISVWQLPHVEVATQSPVNVIREPTRPKLAVDVRDLTGQRLLADVTVYDHRHRVVAEDQREVGGGAPMTWQWTPALPGYGWYLVDLLVRESPSAGASADTLGPVARTVSAFLWIPAEAHLPSDDRHRFALLAEETPAAELALLPRLLETARLDAVVISAWSRQTTLDSLDERQDQIDGLLRTLLTAGRSVTMSLHPVPQELSELDGVDTSHPLGVLRSSPDTWLPYLAPVLMRQGQRVRQWQLGQSHDAEAFFHGDLAGMLGQIDRQFRQLAPQPRIILPWRLDQSRRPELTEDLVMALDVPAAVDPQHLDQHLEEWRRPPADYWLYLHEPPADEVAHDGRVRDLATRMVHGWATGAAGLALPTPWAPNVEREEGIWPDPLLGVFTNAAHRLAGRRFVTRFVPADGMELLVFDGERGGLIVSLSRGEEGALDLYLGEAPVAIDLWGNRAPLPLRNGTHRLEVTAEPRFIEGIDAELALLRAGFRVTPEFVEALQAPHDHVVSFHNPWGRTISGRLQFTGPDGWRVQPQRHFFSLSPGQTLQLPVQMTFPFAELAGPKRLTASFDFTADRHYRVDLWAPMELGLRDVEFHPTVAMTPAGEPGSHHAEVVCVINNTGDRALTLSAFANLRNHPRQERPIANLQPGQSVVRRFRFENVAAADRTAPLRVGLRETNGPAVLNRQLDLVE